MMQRLPLADWTVLGFSLHPDAVAPALRKITAEASCMKTRLALIEPQQALHLLSGCLEMAKVQYILRTSHAWESPEGLRKYDDVIHASLQEVASSQLHEDARLQTGLSIRWGGLSTGPRRQSPHPPFWLGPTPRLSWCPKLRLSTRKQASLVPRTLGKKRPFALS